MNMLGMPFMLLIITIMFAECMGFERADLDKESLRLDAIKNNGRPKTKTIRIGGSCKDSSPANSSGYSSNKSQTGIDITKKSHQNKNRSNSVIKGPAMCLDRIKRMLAVPNQ